MNASISTYSLVFLRSLVGHEVLVSVNTGEHYRGLLCYVGDDMHIQLTGAQVWRANAIEHVGDISIQGHLIENAQPMYTRADGGQRSAAQRAITFEGDYEIPVMMEEYGAPVDEPVTSPNQDSRSLMLDTGIESNVGLVPSTLVPDRCISLPGPSTLVPDHRLSLPGLSTQFPGPSTLFPGTSTLFPGTSTSLPGTSTLFPGTNTSFLEPSTSVPEPSTSVLETVISFPGQSLSAPCLSRRQYGPSTHPHPYLANQFGSTVPPAYPSSTSSSTTLVGDTSDNNSGSTTPHISPTVSRIDAQVVQPDPIYTDLGIVPSDIQIAINFDEQQGTALITEESDQQSQHPQSRMEPHRSAERNEYVYDDVIWPAAPNPSPSSSRSGILFTELGPSHIQSGCGSYEADHRRFQPGPIISQPFARNRRSVPSISQSGPSLIPAWPSTAQPASSSTQPVSGTIEAGLSTSQAESSPNLDGEASPTTFLTSSSSSRHDSHTSHSDESNDSI